MQEAFELRVCNSWAHFELFGQMLPRHMFVAMEWCSVVTSMFGYFVILFRLIELDHPPFNQASLLALLQVFLVHVLTLSQNSIIFFDNDGVPQLYF
jgi:hypothetical protein